MAAISRILVFGVLFDTAVSAGGPILNMAGLQLYNLADNVCGLFLNLALNLAFVPVLAGPGAAWAWTLTFLCVGAARVLQVRRNVLGIVPFSQADGGTCCSRAGRAASSASASGCSCDEAWAVVPVSVIMIVVYIVVSLVLGVDEDERRIAHLFLKPAAALAA